MISNNVTTFASMQSARYGPSMIYLNNLLYVFGGDGAESSIEIYNFTTNTWSLKTYSASTFYVGWNYAFIY